MHFELRLLVLHVVIKQFRIAVNVSFTERQLPGHLFVFPSQLECMSEHAFDFAPVVILILFQMNRLVGWE